MLAAQTVVCGKVSAVSFLFMNVRQIHLAELLMDGNLQKNACASEKDDSSPL